MKKQILAWADSPVASTGYGTVTRHVLKALYSTGEYDIDVIGINHPPEFHDHDVFPYNIIPAKMYRQGDPHGVAIFKSTIFKKQYDYIWIMNDYYIINMVAKALLELRQLYAQNNKTPPIIFGYFPIDSKIYKNASQFFDVIDVPVGYADYAEDKILEVVPEIKDRLKIIHPGVDVDNFYPLNNDQIKEVREKQFGIKPEDDTFLIMSVARNNLRKQLPLTLLAFNEFKKIVPNSKLYLHTRLVDRQENLLPALDDLKLTNHDVIAPLYRKQGFSIDYLNNAYNAADCFLSTASGEGWGIPQTEAMATKTLCVVPDNTTSPEIYGYGTRGIMYPCKNKVYIDENGYRPVGTVDDIVDGLILAYNLNKEKNKLINNAYNWCHEKTWDIIGIKWIYLFKYAQRYDILNTQIQEDNGNIDGDKI